MKLECEKRRKVAHVLNTIIHNNDLSKIELRRLSGYSMGTVNRALECLLEDDLIVINTEREKHQINFNPKIVMGGVSYFRSKLYGTLMTLRGEVISSKERLVNKRENLADSITLLLEQMLSGVKPKLMAIGVSVTTKDNKSLKNVLALRFGVPIYLMDNLGAIAMHQRYVVEKNNNHVIVLYIDDRVRCAKVMFDCEWIELGSLLSPIISAKRGRLHYDEVLSTDTVLDRLSTKNQTLESLFEASAFESDAFPYFKQIKYALGELLLLLDKTVKPKTIVVAGDYIKEELIEGSLDTLGENVRADICCLGSGNREIIEGAPCIALNNLLYY